MNAYTGQVPDILGRPGEWTQDAACRGEDPELFFDDTAKRYAKQVCLLCPVLADCREWILSVERGRSYRLRFGIFAGLTRMERVRLDRTAPQPTAKEQAEEARTGQAPRPAPTAKPRTPRTKPRLKPRGATWHERRIYVLWSSGLSDLQIARRMTVSVPAVKRVRERLGLLPNLHVRAVS